MTKRVKRVATGVTLLAVSIGVASCLPQTVFKGAPQFPGGALGCFNQCKKIKMEMASFVYVGEYSTACACKPKVANVPGRALDQEQVGREDAAMIAAAAGVEQQRRAAEAQQQQRQQQQPH